MSDDISDVERIAAFVQLAMDEAREGEYRRGWLEGLWAGRSQAIGWLELGWPEHKTLAAAMALHFAESPPPPDARVHAASCASRNRDPCDCGGV